MAEGESSMPLVIFTPQYHRRDRLRPADYDQEDVFDPSHVIALLSTPALRDRIMLQCSRVDLCLQLTVKAAKAAQCPLIVHSGWDPHVIDLGADGRLADPDEIYSFCGSLGSEFRVLPGDRGNEEREEFAQRIHSMATEKCDKIRVVCVSTSVFHFLTQNIPIPATDPLFACINMPSPIADCYAWDEDGVRRQVLGNLSDSNSSVQLKEIRGKEEGSDPSGSSISEKEFVPRVHKLIVVLLSPTVAEHTDFLSAAVTKLSSASAHLLPIAAPSVLSEFSDVLSARLSIVVEVDDRWNLAVADQEDFRARISWPEVEHEKSQTIQVVCARNEVIAAVLQVLFNREHSEDIPYAEIDIAHPEHLVIARDGEELLNLGRIQQPVPLTEEAKEPPLEPLPVQEESNAAEEEMKSDSPRPDDILQGELENPLSLSGTQISEPIDGSKPLDMESIPLALSARTSLNFGEGSERPQSPSFQVEHGILSEIGTEKSEDVPAVDKSISDLAGSRPEAIGSDVEHEALSVAPPPLPEPPQVTPNQTVFVPVFVSVFIDSHIQVSPPLETAPTQPEREFTINPVPVLEQPFARPFASPVVIPPAFPTERVIPPEEVPVFPPVLVVPPMQMHVFSPEPVIPPGEVPAFQTEQVIPSGEVPVIPPVLVVSPMQVHVFSPEPVIPPGEVPVFQTEQVIPPGEVPAFQTEPVILPGEMPVFPPVLVVQPEQMHVFSPEPVIPSEQVPAFSYERMAPSHIGFPSFEESKEVPATFAPQETTLEQRSEPNPYEEYLGSQPPVAAASIPGDCSPPKVTAESLHFARLMELNGYANKLISGKVVDTLQSFHGIKPENPRGEIEAVQSALSTLQSRFYQCMRNLEATLTTFAESRNITAGDVNRLIDDMKVIQREKAAVHESAVELTHQLLHSIQKLQRAVEEKERCEFDLSNSLSLLQEQTPKLPAITLKYVALDENRVLFASLVYRRHKPRAVFWRLRNVQGASDWKQVELSKEVQYIYIHCEVVYWPGPMTLDVKETLEDEDCTSLSFMNPYYPFEFANTLLATNYANIPSLTERLGDEGFELFKRVAVAWLNPSIEQMEPFVQEFLQSYTQGQQFMLQQFSLKGFNIGGEFQVAADRK